MKRFFWVGFVLFLYVICTGCGDTFRPIIIPNPPIFPSPKAAHSVVAINDNGSAAPGSAMVVDVSGDTDVSVHDVGYAPVHAVQQTASQVLVVNHSASNGQADSITKLSFSGTTINGSTTISLPANSAPNFVAVAPTDTTAYVTLPDYVPDPSNFPNDDAVGVVSTQSNNVLATIMVGNNPVALAVTPDKSKLYVANQGDGTISAFNTVDRSARTITGSLTYPPIWLVARTDSQRVYVLEQTTIHGLGGTLAWIDTTSTAGPDAFTVAAVAALPDGSRAYVGSNARFEVDVTISNASLNSDNVHTTYTYSLSSSTPDLLSGMVITISNVYSTGFDKNKIPPSDFDGTFTILSVGGGTFEVANAPTDTYIRGGAGVAPNICPQVTVINATSNTIKTPQITIPGVPGYEPFCSNTRFRLMMAA